MADIKQNSESEKVNSETGSKTTTGGSAASTKTAKEESSQQSYEGGKQNESSIKDTFEQAKDATGKIAGEALGQAKDKAASVIGEQKTNLASGINSVADSIRQIGEDIGGKDKNNQIAALAGKYGDTLAGQVEKFSSYIEDRDIKEIVRDVETFARRNPALFIGGAFALGIIAARFLKSSGSGQSQKRRSLSSGAKNSTSGSASSAANKTVQPS